MKADLQMFKTYLHCKQRAPFRPRQHVSGYFQIRNFFFPDTAHTHPANLTAKPEIINPLSRVE